MKQPRILTALLLAAVSFTSCNKQLKDDVHELQQRVAELKKKNAILKEQAGINSQLLGTNEPIEAVTTFEDNDGKSRKIAGLYPLKADNTSTQYMMKQPGGTWEIYVERYGDVDKNEGAWVYFLYNPVTKEITEEMGGHHWQHLSPYNGSIQYRKQWANGSKINLTLKNIDLQTGDLSLDFSATATGAYTQGVYDVYNYYVPNPGKPVATQFSFAGKLYVYADR